MSSTSSQIIETIGIENNLIYNTIAASTFFFYDQCLTLSNERELIWRPKTTRVTILFYIIRYLTFAIRVVELVFYTDVSGLLRPSHGGCVAWIWFEAAAGHTVFICVEIVLVMRRLYAFYGKNNGLFIILIILFICSNAASITILALGLPHFKVVPSDLPKNIHAGVCIVEKVPSIFQNYWVPGLAFESILFILLLAMFIYRRRKHGKDNTYLLNVFVRDGAWGFAVIFAVLLWSALAFELSPQKGDIALTWLFSALGCVGSHMVLNLRAAAQRHLNLSREAVPLYEMGVDSDPSSFVVHPSSPVPVTPGIAY